MKVLTDLECRILEDMTAVKSKVGRGSQFTVGFKISENNQRRSK